MADRVKYKPKYRTKLVKMQKYVSHIHGQTKLYCKIMEEKNI